MDTAKRREIRARQCVFVIHPDVAWLFAIGLFIACFVFFLTVDFPTVVFRTIISPIGVPEMHDIQILYLSKYVGKGHST